MKPMKQLSLAETGLLPKASKQTQKAMFLAEMNRVVPWSRQEALIEPFCPKKGNGWPPMPRGTMLRIHLMQQWFGYSDPTMEEALHDAPLLLWFAGLDAAKKEGDLTVLTPTKKHAGGKLSKEQKAFNRLLSAILAVVEHPFRVVKRQFGYATVRYRGLTMKTGQIRPH